MSVPSQNCIPKDVSHLYHLGIGEFRCPHEVGGACVLILMCVCVGGGGQFYYKNNTVFSQLALCMHVTVV
jgi:hypothetical protein